MIVRIIVLLLAVLVMASNATEVCASPDVTSVVDDAPDAGPPVLPPQITIPRPELPAPASTCPPLSHASGRMHAVFVFRPPRLSASR